ncbi:MAG: D-alanyl-D-alanine carboxypeptidase family protein [Planctomycetes bacterium]|nr:D-alanyl-D-alanine carboxypeptidase family protein [Planctomycetota bacterium]
MTHLSSRPTALFTTGALVLLAGLAAAAEVADVKRSTTARANASASGGSRGAAGVGHAYAVTRTSGEWVEVQFDGRKAWLRRSDLAVRAGAVKRVTAQSGLRVRAGAGANHRSLGTLPTGALIADRGGSAVWRKISFGGKDGWVAARFLRVVSDGATSAGLVGALDGRSASGGSGRSTTAAAATVAPAGGNSGGGSGGGGGSAAGGLPSAGSGIAWQGGRRIGSIDLVRIDGKPVARSTADAFVRMREAARREGVRLRVVSGFRTQAEQEVLYRRYRQGRGNLAARPGHSNHQNGKALDLNTRDSGVLRWLNRNASRFGFRRTVPSEPWHWEVR